MHKLNTTVRPGPIMRKHINKLKASTKVGPIYNSCIVYGGTRTFPYFGYLTLSWTGNWTQGQISKVWKCPRTPTNLISLVAVVKEERCVTTLITAAKEIYTTNYTTYNYIPRRGGGVNSGQGKVRRFLGIFWTTASFIAQIWSSKNVLKRDAILAPVVKQYK